MSARTGRNGARVFEERRAPERDPSAAHDIGVAGRVSKSRDSARAEFPAKRSSISIAIFPRRSPTARSIYRSVWADLGAEIRRQYEKLIHNELKVTRQKMTANVAPRAHSSSR